MDGLALKHPEDKVQLFTQVRCIVTPHSSSSVLELGFPHSVFPSRFLQRQGGVT